MHSRALAIHDPLISISYRKLFFGIGTIELVIGVLQTMPIHVGIKLVPVIFLSWCFILYHVAAVVLRIENPCPCMGSLTSVPLLETHGRLISFALSGFMFALSIFALRTTSDLGKMNGQGKRTSEGVTN
jgi:hypothetical protein